MADDVRERLNDPVQPPLTTRELAAVSEEVAGCFPPPFERTEMVLLVVDPRNVHACWHVREDDMARARPHGYFDLQVHGLQNTWYVQLWEDAESYIADLGLRRRDGSLVALARSNVIDTPRARQSPDYARAAIKVGSNGTVERVPDLTVAGASTNGVLPKPGMPSEQVRGMVSAYYRRFWPNGKDGGRR